MDNNKDLQQAKALNHQSAAGGNFSNAANSIQKGAEQAKQLNRQSTSGTSFTNSTSAATPTTTTTTGAMNSALEEAKALNQASVQGGNYSNAAGNYGAQDAKNLNAQSGGGTASTTSFTNSIAGMNDANAIDLADAKKQNQKSAGKKKGS